MSCCSPASFLVLPCRVYQITKSHKRNPSKYYLENGTDFVYENVFFIQDILLNVHFKIVASMVDSRRYELLLYTSQGNIPSRWQHTDLTLCVCC